MYDWRRKKTRDKYEENANRRTHSESKNVHIDKSIDMNIETEQTCIEQENRHTL